MRMDVGRDLIQLFRNHKQTEPCLLYQKIICNQLSLELAYTTPVMVGLITTLLNNKLMMAYNLIQNAIDEAKGAARLHLIAERYAAAGLKKLMLRHVGDEMRHSRLFAQMVPLTGHEYEEDTSEEKNEQTVSDLYDFDDDLKMFICRVHSIEVRSWVMLRHYLSLLNEHTDF